MNTVGKTIAILSRPPAHRLGWAADFCWPRRHRVQQGKSTHTFSHLAIYEGEKGVLVLFYEPIQFSKLIYEGEAKIALGRLQLNATRNWRRSWLQHSRQMISSKIGQRCVFHSDYESELTLILLLWNLCANHLPVQRVPDLLPGWLKRQCQVKFASSISYTYLGEELNIIRWLPVADAGQPR